jgi:polysaccharide export outer membrane protein
MNHDKRRFLTVLLLGAVIACLSGTGCVTCQPDPKLCASDIPRELTKVSLPEYVIEPPDILLLDAIRLVPQPPYRVEPLDVLLISVPNVLPAAEPITGPYVVESDGTINLGEYGTIRVAGLTLEEVREAVKNLVGTRIKDPVVNVGLGQSRAMQQIRGEHLVRPDGTIGLGTYGSVRVVGLTLAQARSAIEEHLSQKLQKPEISVDVFAYNSKAYYVIFDLGGLGQQVYRLPVTGSDTVLDAIGQVNGLTLVSSKYHLWVARPSQACAPCDQVMPVDWVGITTRGRTESNYQLLPGDRLYVKADAFVEIDTRLARFLAPFERAFGFTLLGSGTVFTIERNTAGGKFSKGQFTGGGQ